MGFSGAIYPRILAPFILALTVGALSAWWLASSLFADTLHTQRRQQLTNAISALAGGNLPLTPSLLDRLGQVLQAELVLITPDGDLSGEPPPRATAALKQGLGSDPSRAGQQAFSAIRQIDGERYSILIQPLVQGTDNRYAAIAAVSGLAELRDASRQMAVRLGLGALLGTILLGWLAHRIAQGITVPIAHLSGMARRISAGNLSVRAQITKPEELAALADTLNVMTSQLQEYQRRIVEQNRLQALGQMAARVAHEIRNPLTAIKLQIQLLGETLHEAGQTRRSARLLDEVRRLELIVSAMLMAGKEVELRLQPMDPNQLIGDVVELQQPQLAHRGIELQSALHPLPRVALDPDRIKQVLFNLINNAADELPEGGRIRITTDLLDQDELILMQIEDSGPGVPEALWGQLFTASATHKPHGLGMGLIICRELLELHRGSIEVDRSPRLGGARFRVTLPVGRSTGGIDNPARGDP